MITFCFSAWPDLFHYWLLGFQIHYLKAWIFPASTHPLLIQRLVHDQLHSFEIIFVWWLYFILLHFFLFIFNSLLVKNLLTLPFIDLSQCLIDNIIAILIFSSGCVHSMLIFDWKNFIYSFDYYVQIFTIFLFETSISYLLTSTFQKETINPQLYFFQGYFDRFLALFDLILLFSPNSQLGLEYYN